MVLRTGKRSIVKCKDILPLCFQRDGEHYPCGNEAGGRTCIYVIADPSTIRTFYSNGSVNEVNKGVLH